ncbi:MAG: ABC transporter substrate-binding protein [Caldilinea sp.]|nr:ABC transporter substrate-binding protein [Caldilineaceae bacterium]MCO5209261.1 ABC transporter substrate-binding protein [Caldilinea sp.]HRW47253.1 ABC transporter substrate-binding protein [Caldilinea sp.]
MKNKRVVLLLLGLLLISAMVSACAAPVAPAAPAGGEEAAATEAAPAEAAADDAAAKPYIPVISKGFQHQFWQAVKLGSEQAAADLNVDITFEGPATESEVDKQIEMLTAALAKNPAAICFAALDTQAAIPLLEEAQAKGIPVVGFDSGVDSDIPVATASTDNIAAAALAADKMAELIGGEGQVAVLVHDQTSRTGIDRRDGFLNRMAEAYPNIEIVNVDYGAGDHLKSTDLAKAVMQANPDLKGYFGANEGSIIGVLNAATELGKEGLVIIGYDSGAQQIQAIRDGLQAGAITQNPIGIGYKCVEAAVKAINGEPVDKVIDTGFFWYDATNIDSDEIKAVLYE